jgi:mono/diheme cytochrome c family protein
VAGTSVILPGRIGLALLTAVALASSVRGAPSDAAAVLESRCVACHQPAKQRGGLDLTTRDAALRGGDRGPALVPGDSRASLLYRLVTHASKPEMPHKQEKLPADEVARIAAWIDSGAAYPRPLVPPGAKAASGLWSLRPLKPVEPPPVTGDWCRTPIDRFVLAALRARGLSPSARADKRTLIRRATFDLTGLPPTREEIDSFIKDDSPRAWEDLVDRLLASPAYGERWGRHWLDVARYADSDGYELDDDRPHAFHYRDFVIRAFNDDMPFDTFARWNLAGDELQPDDPRARVATGFCTAGPVVIFNDAVGRGTPLEREKARYDELDDIVSTLGQAFLGMTTGCARCHDHKFDPIPSRDYYRLVAAFANSRRTQWGLRGAAAKERYDREIADIKRECGQTKQELDSWYEARIEEVRNTRIDQLPITEAEKRILRRPATPGDTARARLVGNFPTALNVSGEELSRALTPEQRARWEQLKAATATARARHEPKAPPVALCLVDGGREPVKSFVLGRGDPSVKRDEVTAGFLSAVSSQPPEHWTRRRRPAAATTYQRAAVAEWLTDVEAGAGRLLARVLVNRLWQHHFGEGLVRTPNDFGAQGEPPTHPELLDWLADRLIAGGWKVKPLHRLIMASAAYTQTSAVTPEQLAGDVEGRFLSHRTPLRLEAESIRDSILAVSGKLDRTMFGPAVKPALPDAPVSPKATAEPTPRPTGDGPDQWRRAVYLFAKRSRPTPLLEMLDAPAGIDSCGRRNCSTVAPQALLLLNDAFVRRQAGYFAERVASEAGPAPEDRVRRAYVLALGRPPVAAELRKSVAFLRAGEGRATLLNFCHVLLTLNEFCYVD